MAVWLVWSRLRTSLEEIVGEIDDGMTDKAEISSREIGENTCCHRYYDLNDL